MPPESTNQPTNQPTAWETWLAAQPEDVRKQYEEHVGGLKSALESEREQAKDLRKQAKRLAELEKAEADRQKAEADRLAAQLSETEKLQRKVSEAERKASQLEEELGRTRLRSAVERAAASMFHDPSDAYMLADLSAVTAGEDGTYKGIQEALDALAKAKPHLVKAAATTATTTVAGVPASPKPVPPQQVTQTEVDRRKAQVGQDVRQRF